MIIVAVLCELAMTLVVLPLVILVVDARHLGGSRGAYAWLLAAALRKLSITVLAIARLPCAPMFKSIVMSLFFAICLRCIVPVAKKCGLSRANEWPFVVPPLMLILELSQAVLYLQTHPAEPQFWGLVVLQEVRACETTAATGAPTHGWGRHASGRGVVRRVPCEEELAIGLPWSSRCRRVVVVAAETSHARCHVCRRAGQRVGAQLGRVPLRQA